jgi:hypothetical protein
MGNVLFRFTTEGRGGIMSEDALDRPRGKQGFGKAQKRAYAKEKQMEELLMPPKNGLAEFLTNPALLPKKPPSRRPVE